MTTRGLLVLGVLVLAAVAVGGWALSAMAGKDDKKGSEDDDNAGAFDYLMGLFDSAKDKVIQAATPGPEPMQSGAAGLTALAQNMADVSTGTAKSTTPDGFLDGLTEMAEDAWDDAESWLKGVVE